MSAWIKSPLCSYCDGFGYIWHHHENPAADSEKEQCEECERIAEIEKNYDRDHEISRVAPEET